MKPAAVVVLLASASASADASFDEYSDKVRQQPANQLFEASCDLDIDMRGALATISVRQRIANPGPDELAAMIQLPLPTGGQVTQFATRADRGIAVARDTDTVDPSPVLGVDPALLTREGYDYRIVLQPIAADHEAILETTIVAPAVPRGGSLRLVLPARDASKLTACRGNVRAAAGPGGTIKKIRIDNVETAGARAGFALHDKDVTIDVDVEIAATQPIVWMQTQPLVDGWNASLVTVLAPRVKPSGSRRVVFVIDGSKSMELVGRHTVAKVVNRIGAALPSGAEVEAIIYDRKVTPVFGAVRPATPDAIAAIEAAITKRTAQNGSDILGAFAKARAIVESSRGQTMVIAISDGVTPDIDGQDLIAALGGKTSTVDVHAIVLDPATTQAPSADALRAPVNLLGGAYVEVSVDELDTALVAIDDWLRPSWVELAGIPDAPKEIRAGAGFTHLAIHKGAFAPKLTGHGETKFTSPARGFQPIPGLGAFVLATTTATAFTTIEYPNDNDIEAARPIFDKARAAHPVADDTFSFAVLTSVGKVAKSRKQMVAGGGKYERVIQVGDPTSATSGGSASTRATRTASAISSTTLERLFRDQLQPKAFACYQRALGKNPKLGGTATFTFLMGRGEVTDVKVTSLGDTAFDACLVDAGYAVAPPMPDFSLNIDDQTIANYPLTFARRADEQATIVLGDADSSSPLDIDAIQGGVPGRRPSKADTSTPLGRMKPPKSP